MNHMLIAHKLHETPPEYREKYLKDNGWQLIGAGCWKDVYGRDDADFVVKIAVDYSYPNGMREHTNFKTAPAHIKPFLLPLLTWGEGFQIQERIVLRPCPDDCPGVISGMADSASDDEKCNHTHAEDGTLIIMDYGQETQWV
jgi:hypothetical protein